MKIFDNFTYTAEFEVPGTWFSRRNICTWIDNQDWNKEVMMWQYELGKGEPRLTIYATEEKYLDILYLTWGEHLRTLLQKEEKQ